MSKTIQFINKRLRIHVREYNFSNDSDRKVLISLKYKERKWLLKNVSTEKEEKTIMIRNTQRKKYKWSIIRFKEYNVKITRYHLLNYMSKNNF